VEFLPLVNSPEGKIQEFKVSDVKFFLKYRYMFQRTGIEIWLCNKKRSILLVFEDHNI
jgi:factor associated with neutral sphingomyelinase activation